MPEPLFDLSGQYEEMLMRGVRLSGEKQEYFIIGRVRDLKAQLPPGTRVGTILDFGCGIGKTTRAISREFPEAQVVGTDLAENALAYAAGQYSSPKISFCPLRDLSGFSQFDLCHTSGVFHHIQPGRRVEAIRLIHDLLVPGGHLALFENNPWNPGARMVMSRIPFDRDAQPLSPLEARRLLKEGGFRAIKPARSLFYFPRALGFLRFAEPWLAGIPLGAQYYLLATKARPTRNSMLV